MAVNSPSSNDSLLHPIIPVYMYCLMTEPSSFIFTAFYITNILVLLPLCILVLYLGLQRWWRHCSASAAAAAMTSHSDSFTYHMVAMELIGVFGCTLCYCSIYGDHVDIFSVGYYLWALTWYGEMFFHILTCVERYLAVVRPVTYLSLRKERGIRIRNITNGCVWLLSFGTTGLTTLKHVSVIVQFGVLIFSLFVISFCSLSVLCVLIRPGPGKQGGTRERVEQSKQKAFYTIVTILVVLLLRCSSSVFWAVFNLLREGIDCVGTVAGNWLNVPSSLVLPLLFLHRVGTLACSKNNAQCG